MNLRRAGSRVKATAFRHCALVTDQRAQLVKERVCLLACHLQENAEYRDDRDSPAPFRGAPPERSPPATACPERRLEALATRPERALPTGSEHAKRAPAGNRSSLPRLKPIHAVLRRKTWRAVIQRQRAPTVPAYPMSPIPSTTRKINPAFRTVPDMFRTTGASLAAPGRAVEPGRRVGGQASSSSRSSMRRRSRLGPRSRRARSI
jgi:hypothetical protein